jgi:integrase
MDLDYKFFNGFKTYYLQKDPPIQNSTILKRMRSFKVFLNHKYELGILENPYYQKYKIDLSVNYKREVIIPTTREVEILTTCTLNDRRIDDARDLYLIGCSTGLRYSDVVKLTKDRIKDGYILTDILKTGQTLTIPLNTISEKFISKQFKKYDDKVWDISNQKLNVALRDLFEYLSDNHPEKPFSSKEIVFVQYGPKAKATYPIKSSVLAFHSSRRFFISYCVNSGLIGLGNVMKWSGHTEIKTVNSYIKKGFNEQDQMRRLFSFAGDPENSK